MRLSQALTARRPPRRTTRRARAGWRACRTTTRRRTSTPAGSRATRCWRCSAASWAARRLAARGWPLRPPRSARRSAAATLMRTRRRDPGLGSNPRHQAPPPLPGCLLSLLVRQGSNRRYRCGWPVSVSAVMPGVLACPVTGRYRGPRRCFWLMAARRERLQCVFGVWRPGQRGGAHSELGRRVSPAQLAGIPSVRHSRCS